MTHYYFFRQCLLTFLILINLKAIKKWIQISFYSHDIMQFLIEEIVSFKDSETQHFQYFYSKSKKNEYFMVINFQCYRSTVWPSRIRRKKIYSKINRHWFTCIFNIDKINHLQTYCLKSAKFSKKNLVL